MSVAFRTNSVNTATHIRDTGKTRTGEIVAELKNIRNDILNQVSEAQANHTMRSIKNSPYLTDHASYKPKTIFATQAETEWQNVSSSSENLQVELKKSQIQKLNII